MYHHHLQMMVVIILIIHLIIVMVEVQIVVVGQLEDGKKLKFVNNMPKDVLFKKNLKI